MFLLMKVQLYLLNICLSLYQLLREISVSLTDKSSTTVCSPASLSLFLSAVSCVSGRVLRFVFVEIFAVENDKKKTVKGKGKYYTGQKQTYELQLTNKENINKKRETLSV